MNPKMQTRKPIKSLEKQLKEQGFLHTMIYDPECATAYQKDLLSVYLKEMLRGNSSVELYITNGLKGFDVYTPDKSETPKMVSGFTCKGEFRDYEIALWNLEAYALIKLKQKVYDGVYIRNKKNKICIYAT